MLLITIMARVRDPEEDDLFVNCLGVEIPERYGGYRNRDVGHEEDLSLIHI